MQRRSFVRGLASLGAIAAMPKSVFSAVLAAGDPIDPAATARLTKAIKGAVYLPGVPEYEKLRHGFAAKVDLHPALIVHAVSNDDVAQAVLFAREQHVPLAVRCGGHSYAGYNSCDGGVVIDLSGLRTMAVAGAGDHATVRIGGGSLCGAIEQETAKSGQATTLGQCPSVGAGGYLLGGGVGPLMSRHGLGCDNVVSAEMVLADGRTVTASAKDNPDLYWAIRGGGGNFGVATSFTLKLHPVSDVWAGFLDYGAADPATLLRILRDMTAAAPDAMTVIAVLSPSQEHGFGLSVQVCHVGDAAAGRAAIAEQLKADALIKNGIVSQPYLALEQLVPFDIPPVHWENRGGFLPALTDDVIDRLAQAIRSGPGIYDELSFIQLHGAVTKVPLAATAFPMRTPGFAYGIASTWLPATGPAKAAAWVDATAEALAGLGKGAYVNVMGREDEASVRAAYDSNYARLASIKAKYDPSNLFAINQNIRPAA